MEATLAPLQRRVALHHTRDPQMQSAALHDSEASLTFDRWRAHLMASHSLRLSLIRSDCCCSHCVLRAALSGSSRGCRGKVVGRADGSEATTCAMLSLLFSLCIGGASTFEDASAQLAEARGRWIAATHSALSAARIVRSSPPSALAASHERTTPRLWEARV